MSLRSRRHERSIPFADRAEAGRALARKLLRYADRRDVVVLGLARGGVPVGFEVAQALQAPLDVFVVRKLGVPGQEELAMGAIASGQVRFMNAALIEELGLTRADVDAVVRREQRELERRERLYRDDRPIRQLRDRVLILVDDGLATGASMRAAIAALRKHRPARIVAAVPIAARETCRALVSETDEMVCAAMPAPFVGVGFWYDDFSQTTDAEVHTLLTRIP